MTREFIELGNAPKYEKQMKGETQATRDQAFAFKRLIERKLPGAVVAVAKCDHYGWQVVCPYDDDHRDSIRAAVALEMSVPTVWGRITSTT